MDHFNENRGLVDRGTRTCFLRWEFINKKREIHKQGNAFFFLKESIIPIYPINTMRTRQNGHHFPDDIFKWLFLNENVLISINISLKFVPRSPINNILTLVQIMAWRRQGDKPLCEPTMVRLPTHICIYAPLGLNDFSLVSLHIIK